MGLSPNAVPDTAHMLFLLVFTSTLKGRLYLPHFIDDETESQSG